MLDRQLRRLEKKFGKYAIKGLMLYIVAGMFMLYIGELVARNLPNVDGSIFSFLYFDKGLIMQGQVWRIISFIFLPPDGNPIFVVFELYFCWLFGSSLEEHWGSFRFNVYYLLGTVGAVISGFITGTAANHYLNLSLLIAFAMIYPDYEILLFFIIPVKMKWIAWLDAAFLIWTLVLGTLQIKVLILFSFANLLLFFGRDMYEIVAGFIRRKTGRPKSVKRKKQPVKRAKTIDISRRDVHDDIDDK